MMMLALIFPCQFCTKQFKIGISVLLIYTIISMGSVVFFAVNNPLAGVGDGYIVCGFVWTMVYLKFSS